MNVFTSTPRSFATSASAPASVLGLRVGGASSGMHAPTCAGRQNRGRRNRRLRLSGMPVHQALTLSAEAESGKVPRRDPRQDETNQRRKPPRDHRQGQSNADRLVRIHQTQLSNRVPQPRRLDPDAPPRHPATARRMTRRGTSTPAQRLLRRTRTVQLANRTCSGCPILTQVTPSTGGPDVRNSPVRSGGRKVRPHSDFPDPIEKRHGNVPPVGLSVNRVECG